MSVLAEKVLLASAGRDRVVDAVKALALMLVILGHGLAWTILPDGSAVNTLEAAPGLFWLTWVLQILPLFFLMAGVGLMKMAKNPTGPAVLSRVDRLASPTLPLLGIALILSLVLGRFAGPDMAGPAGILPIQLTWFIGVYLFVVAAAPLLARLHAVWHFLAFLAAIGLVDVLRVNVNDSFGWINLVLVWSLFAAIGMHLPKLRTLPVKVVAPVGAAAASAAVLLIIFGPYSPALITTTALPGISNLAPPTLVLAFAGIVQVCVLLIVWPLLARLLSNDRVWVPVAVFSARAMALYLYHMLFISLGIAVVLLSGFRPPALSLGWWAEHALVLGAAFTAAWLLDLPLLRLGDMLGNLAARTIPTALAVAASRSRLWGPTVLASICGLCYMLMSESGIADPLKLRTVIGLPYMPIVVLVVITFSVALARAARIKART